MFKTRDGADILISIQNDREWRVLAEKVMDDAALAADPQFATVTDADEAPARDRRQGRGCIRRHGRRRALGKLEAADIAFARVNDVAGFIAHPHLRRISVETPSGPVSYPAPAAIRDQPRSYGRVPASASIPRRSGRSLGDCRHPEAPRSGEPGTA